VQVTNPTAGVVSWTPKYKTFTRQQIEDSIRLLPEMAGRELSFDCHANVFLSVPNSQIACDVTDQASARGFVATYEFTDEQGSGAWQLDPPIPPEIVELDAAPTAPPSEAPVEAEE
jgi:hypothetical protein